MAEGPDWHHGHRHMEETERRATLAGPTDPRSHAERVLWDQQPGIQATLDAIFVVVRRIVDALTTHG